MRDYYRLLDNPGERLRVRDLKESSEFADISNSTIYQSHWKTDESPFVVLVLGSKKMTIKYVDEDYKGLIRTVFYSDYGLAPYDGGKWNQRYVTLYRPYQWQDDWF
jgi:hypothetical protein